MIITVGNARCMVQAPLTEQSQLSQHLSIATGAKNWAGHDVVQEFFKPGQASFPAGLFWKLLTWDVPDWMSVEIKMSRSGPVLMSTKPIEIPGVTYRDYQKEGIEEILKSRQGLVKVATNGGKTIIMAGALKSLVLTRARGIVLIHRAEIFEQLVETFNKYVPGGVGELRQGKKDVEGRQFVVAMAQMLVNRIGDDEDVTRLYEEADVLFADEGHHLQSKTWNDLFMFSNASFKVGFTGTVQDENTYEGWLVRSCTGRVLIDVSNRELMESGVSATVDATMWRVDSAELFEGFYYSMLDKFKLENPVRGTLVDAMGKWTRPDLKLKFFGMYRKACEERGVVENEKRNKLLCARAQYHVNMGRQTLMVVERVLHGERLLKMMQEYGVESVHFLHGSDPDRKDVMERYRIGDLRLLISTQVLDEGVDISGIRALIIAGGRKAKRAFLQRIGRGLRFKEGENVLYVDDVWDRGNKYMEGDAAARLKLFEAEGFKVKKEKVK